MEPYYLDLLHKRVPGRDLVAELWRRVLRRLGANGSGRRVEWTPADVIDADGPELALRCYLECRDIRKMLDYIPAQRRGFGVEVGCGFGRLTPVLAERFTRAIGIERDLGLLETARALNPKIEFISTLALNDLSALPAKVDFIMTFTVLMHMTDQDVVKTLKAIKEKAAGGWVLIVERTAPGLVAGDNTNPDSFMDQGRAISTFEGWMKPFRLLQTLPREVEPTHWMKDHGHYMLFSDARSPLTNVAHNDTLNVSQ